LFGQIYYYHAAFVFLTLSLNTSAKNRRFLAKIEGHKFRQNQKRTGFLLAVGEVTAPIHLRSIRDHRLQKLQGFFARDIRVSTWFVKP